MQSVVMVWVLVGVVLAVLVAAIAVTVVLEVQHQLPPSLKFLHGGVYEAYSFIGDLAGVVFVIGVGIA